MLDQGRAPLAFDCVANANDAEAFLQQAPPFSSAPQPDLILMNLDPASNDGRKLLEHWDGTVTKHVPVVVCSDSTSAEGRQFASDCGVAGHLTKPFSVGALVKVLLDVLHDRSVLIAQLEGVEHELRRAMEELVRSNAELDDFAYTVSHDLKEPLRGIRNYITYLEEDCGPELAEDAAAKLDAISRLTTHLNGLIEGVLSYSRIGRVELQTQDTDLHDIVTDILGSLKPLLTERHIDVRIPHRLPVVSCDPVGAGQVFRNLITNAIKYNNKDNPWIEIGRLERCPAGAHIVIEPKHTPEAVFFVRDNGIGIPRETPDGDLSACSDACTAATSLAAAPESD